MKQCPQCFAQNPDNAAFCEGCGADLRNVAAMPDGRAAAPTAPTAPNGPGAWNAAPGPQGGMDGGSGWNTAPETQGYAPNGGTAPQGGNSILVDQSETVVASIGSSYLQNYLSGGSVSMGVGVLTQKRFYYKGRNFSGEGKAMKSTTEEGVVSIEDITFTMFSHTRHIGALVFGILLAVVGAFFFLMAFNTRDSSSDIFGFGGIGLMVAGLFFLVLYFINRKSLFVISFPGGGFAFDIRWYPINDIRDFQRQLHLLKDHIKENA